MNLLVIHLHDMGRHCSPYGYELPSPNIEKLALAGQSLLESRTDRTTKCHRR